MSEQPASLAAALVQLQARLPHVTKDAEADTGKYKYRYADLATITAAIFPLLAELGLYWVCMPTVREDGQFVLHYELSHHHAGSSITGDYPLPNATPQTIGGAITYARRYALCAVTGVVADEDDDGQASEAEAKARQGQEWRPPARPNSHAKQHLKGGRQLPADDDWTSPGPDTDASDQSTKAQRNAIATLAARLGAADDGDRHELIRQALGFEVPTRSTDISVGEASRVIKWMQDRVNS